MAHVFSRMWPAHVTTVEVKRLDHPHDDTTDNCLLTLIAQLFVGSNLICTAIHRALTRLFETHRDHDPYIEELFLQVDNCTGENKNHTLLGYLGSLVGRGVVGRVEMNFMMVGHTHILIDQVFSR